MPTLTRDEWVAKGKPTSLVRFEQIQVARDYLRLAHRLLDGTSCELECCKVEGANHTVTVTVSTGNGAVRDTAAAVLLQENWFYDWLPIGTRVAFMPHEIDLRLCPVHLT